MRGSRRALWTGRALGQVTQITGAQSRIITNIQSGTAYTVAASDCGGLLSLSNPSGVAVSIPLAGPSGLNAGCWMDIQNTGTGAAHVYYNGSSR